MNKEDYFHRKSLESEGGHTWREYTYRKITPCDACGQVLRGHSRQGVRCRGCKANAHTDCINMVQPALCPSLAPKKSGGIPLLRRQKTQVTTDEVPASSEHSEYKLDTRDSRRVFFPPFSPPSATRQLSHCRGQFYRTKGTDRFLNKPVISRRLDRGDHSVFFSCFAGERRVSLHA